MQSSCSFVSILGDSWLPAGGVSKLSYAFWVTRMAGVQSGIQDLKFTFCCSGQKSQMITGNVNVEWLWPLTGTKPLQLLRIIYQNNAHDNTLNSCSPCILMHWAHYTWVWDIKWAMDQTEQVPQMVRTVMCLNEPVSHGGTLWRVFIILPTRQTGRRVAAIQY